MAGVRFILTPLQALGLDLKVKACKDIEVLANAYLPETLTTGDGHLPEHNIYHWVLKRPMLPNQGVYLTWKSKAGADLENRADGVEMYSNTQRTECFRIRRSIYLSSVPF